MNGELMVFDALAEPELGLGGVRSVLRRPQGESIPELRTAMSVDVSRAMHHDLVDPLSPPILHRITAPADSAGSHPFAQRHSIGSRSRRDTERSRDQQHETLGPRWINGLSTCWQCSTTLPMGTGEVAEKQA